MDELLTQFLIEGPELAQEGAEALLELERAPGERAPLDQAFRAVHTLKGSVGLFDLPAMALMLHAAEDVLSAVREGQRGVDRTMIGRLLSVLDQSQAWLEVMAAQGAAILPDAAQALAQQLAIELSQAGPPAAAPVEAARPAPDWVLALVATLPEDLRAIPLTAIRYEPQPGCYFSGDDPLAILAKAPGLAALTLSRRTGSQDGPYDPFTCDLVIQAASRAPLAEVKAAFRFVPDQVQLHGLAPEAKAGEALQERPGEAAGRSLRVDAGRIEALAALVDELIAAKNGLAGLLAQAKAGAQTRDLTESLAAHYGLIDRLTGQAHQRVTALRVAPVRALLRRFPRVVRDMAESLGKDVELVIEGDGVEADRGIVEGLFEPLTHLLRNAVDHGIESAGERLRAGKPARSTIVLDVREQGGRLRLTVRDDGRGIDLAAVRTTAARRGLIDAAALAAMDDAAALDLIFVPGFSTARVVTALSGRGVGMDAIRAAVRRLGGRISMATQPGAGTTAQLVLPLAVSLTQVMLVSHGGERYGVPMSGVLETVRLRPGQAVPIRAGHAFNWRDQAVPLLALSAVTGAAPMPPEGDQRVLVVRAGGQPVGLAIDAVEDRLEVAMRPMDGLLASLRGLAGAAVLGDGQVLMILDPEALIG